MWWKHHLLCHSEARAKRERRNLLSSELLWIWAYRAEVTFWSAGRILREVLAIRTEELPNGLTTSIGVACIPECAGDHGGLLEQADRALYASKEAGRNQARKADSTKGKDSEVETPKV